MLEEMDARGFFNSFGKYSAVGIISFLLDLALLTLLVEKFSVPYQAAVPAAFFVITSLQHYANRHLVFSPSARHYSAEYLYFIAIAIVAGAIVTGATMLFVEYFGFSVYAGRIFASGLGGLWSFYVNARFNFRAF